MEEIWKMQRTLNEFCFAKRAIGDYDRVIRDGGAVWLPNFCRAMLHELAEYCEWMDASERRSENEAEARNKRADAAVEAIDILHFLASAGHCADFDGIGATIAAVEAFSSPCRPWRVVSMEFFRTTCRLEDRAHWQWWWSIGSHPSLHRQRQPRSGSGGRDRTGFRGRSVREPPGHRLHPLQQDNQ